MLKIQTNCPFCDKNYVIKVDATKEQLRRWKNVSLIQSVMPKVDLTTRESLISGMCSNCQKELF